MKCMYISVSECGLTAIIIVVVIMANNSALLLRNASLDEVESKQIGDAYIWLGFVIILIILVCNTTPLVVMAKDAQLKKHRFFRFLICLSVNAIMTSPFLLGGTAFRKLTPATNLSKLRIYFDCLLFQSYLHQGIIALERFFASGTNFDRYRKLFTSLRQTMYLVLSYVIVGVFAVVVLGMYYEFDERTPKDVYGRNHHFILFIYGCSVLTFMFLIAMITFVCTYRVVQQYRQTMRFVAPVSRHRFQRSHDKSQNSPISAPFQVSSSSVETPANHQIDKATLQERNIMKEKAITKLKSRRSVDIIKTFLLVLVVVLFFNVPYLLTRILLYLDLVHELQPLINVTFILTVAQYAACPFIYLFRIQPIRKSIKSIFINT